MQVRSSGTPWTPEGFDGCIQRWDELESPPADLRIWVVEWIFNQLDDPYQGVKRAAGFPNLWWGQVPGTLHGDGMVVVCNYWIVETVHVVRCESVASLSWPV
jgi:hypothetical protein